MTSADSKKKGYAKIPTSLLDKLATVNISSYEMRILAFILRKTIGFGKKEDYISLSQFALGCELDKRLIARSIKKLCDKNIIYRDDNYRRRYSVELEGNKWLSSVKMKPKKVICIDDESHLYRCETSSVEIHTIDTIQKTTKQKIVDTTQKPKDINQLFFDCVKALKARSDHPFKESFGQMVEKIQESFPGMPKGFIWVEIQDFDTYWTELSQDGKRSRWQMQKTFQVGARLGTWLRKSQKWQKREAIKNRRGRGVAVEE